MSSTHQAIFVSYARQDTGAAQAIAETLRAGGFEVWFDQSELRGGDLWDAKIRKQVKECALFIPIISARTQARAEGYFRLEWRLADQRTHLMGRSKAFIVPVCIDDTGDADADVPESFLAAQWIRAPEGKTDAGFVARIRELIEGQGVPHPVGPAPALSRSAVRRSAPALAAVGLAVGVVAVAAVLLIRSRPNVEAVPTEARRYALQAERFVTKVDSGADDFTTADGLINRAEELDPTDGEIWAIGAEVNAGFIGRGFDRSASRMEASRSSSQRAVNLAPDSARAWLARGDYLRGYVDPTQAEVCLRRALKLAPPKGDVRSRILFGLAGTALAKGDLETAFRFYGQSIDPDRPGSDALAHYNQFLIRFARRQFPEADALAEAAMNELPSPNFVCGRALSLLAWRGDPAGAAALLAKIPESRRGETRTIVVTFLVDLLGGHPQAALDVLAEAPAEYLNDNYFAGPRGLLEGEAQTKLGHAAAAKAAFDSGVAVCQKRHSDAEPDFRKAGSEIMVLAWSGRETEARRLLRVAEERWAGTERGVYITAHGYSALGDADHALPAIKQLLSNTESALPLTPSLLRLDPIWDKIRGDPRFQELLRQ